jgi:hypothetical protein
MFFSRSHRVNAIVVDRDHGLGIEDWSWNLETSAAGIHHGVVPGAVHLIRRRPSGSLDARNLPHSLTRRGDFGQRDG